MGYHIRQINSGVLGKVSKITEEYEEFMDAIDQGNPVLALIELSDLLGAIESYTDLNYRITLNDLILMKERTQSAFTDGSRKSKK